MPRLSMPVSSAATPLYARLVGDRWRSVPQAIDRAHQASPAISGHGCLTIRHGLNPIASVIARMMKLPPAGDKIDTTLLVSASGDGEHWTRNFGGRVLRTEQYGLPSSFLGERFGALEFRFRLVIEGEALLYQQHSVRCVWRRSQWTIPAPIAPRIAAIERAAGAQAIDIEVRVTLPLVGLLLSYAGRVDFEDGRR